MTNASYSYIYNGLKRESFLQKLKKVVLKKERAGVVAWKHKIDSLFKKWYEKKDGPW